MNLYLLLGLAVAWGASVGGAFFYGEGVGEDRIVAKQAAVNTAIQETREAAQQGAADAISKIKVVNTTVRAKTETLIREDVRYRDCVADPGVMRNINSALTGRTPEPVGGVGLPAADGAK